MNTKEKDKCEVETSYGLLTLRIENDFYPDTLNFAYSNNISMLLELLDDINALSPVNCRLRGNFCHDHIITIYGIDYEKIKIDLQIENGQLKFLWASGRRVDKRSNKLSISASQKIVNTLKQELEKVLATFLPQLSEDTKQQYRQDLRERLIEYQININEAIAFVDSYKRKQFVDCLKEQLQAKVEKEKEKINSEWVKEMHLYTINEREFYICFKDADYLWREGRNKSLDWLEKKLNNITLSAINKYMKLFCSKGDEMSDFCNQAELEALKLELLAYYTDSDEALFYG